MMKYFRKILALKVIKDRNTPDEIALIRAIESECTALIPDLIAKTGLHTVFMNGCTPIQLAISNNKPKAMLAIIGCGLDLSQRDSMGNFYMGLTTKFYPPSKSDPDIYCKVPKELLSTLVEAIINAVKSIVRLRASKESNVDFGPELSLAFQPICRENDIHMAILNNRIEDLSPPINTSEVNTISPEKQPPLITAVLLDNPKIIKRLLALGADPSITTTKGWTPIHAAAFHGASEEVLMALLDVYTPSDDIFIDTATPFQTAVEGYIAALARMDSSPEAYRVPELSDDELERIENTADDYPSASLELEDGSALTEENLSKMKQPSSRSIVIEWLQSSAQSTDLIDSGPIPDWDLYAERVLSKYIKIMEILIAKGTDINRPFPGSGKKPIDLAQDIRNRDSLLFPFLQSQSVDRTRLQWGDYLKLPILKIKNAIFTKYFR
jgi:hypothetical protein